MYDVVCVGNIVADVIVRTVDALPPVGSLTYKESISLYNGGCAMSAAVGLSVLGAKSAIIAKIGNDSFGEFLKNKLVQENVNIDGLAVSDYPTSASVALIDSDSERTFLHCPGANAYFSDADVDYDIIAKSKIVFIAGTLIMPSFDGESCARVLKKSREMCKVTALDTAWDSENKWIEKISLCMPYIDWFLPSVEEAEKLSGEKEHDKICDAFFDMGVKHMVVKLGKYGCYLRESKSAEGQYFPAYSNAKPVDTTGAGDSFCAGFLFGLSKGLPYSECCRIGNAVGTHCVMAAGATTGAVPFGQIQKFMAENEGYLK